MKERVAIGRCFRGIGDADLASGAGAVLDDKALMQRALQHIGFEAGQCIGRCAGRERHDDSYRPTGIVIRADRKRRQAAQRAAQEYDMDESAAGGVHRRSRCSYLVPMAMLTPQ
jgi:hypothetical protein